MADTQPQANATVVHCVLNQPRKHELIAASVSLNLYAFG
jgi:hypothetical protein